MTRNDEAKPKQTRRRRATYVKRIEFRITDAQLDVATRARDAAVETTGRKITLSDIARAAFEDGCKSIIKAVQSTPARSGTADVRASEALERFTDEMQGLRTEIRRVGHNVNTMTKVANRTGMVSDDLEDVKAQLDMLDGRLVRIAEAAVDRTTWED